MQNGNNHQIHFSCNIKAILSKMKIRNKFCTIFIMKYITNSWENSVPFNVLLAFQTPQCSEWGAEVTEVIHTAETV